MKDWTAKRLADWVADLRPERIPEEVLAKAEDCIIDAIACAIPGVDVEGAQRIHAVAKSNYRDGEAVIWFSSERLNPTAAAFANSASASILDIDDGHRYTLSHPGAAALGHPGAAVVPAALATCTAETQGIEVLAAVIAGYETCVRVGMAEHRKSYHTGNWTGFGAAVATGRLSGLSREQLLNALAITAYHGPRVADLTLSQDMGANVKESIPWSVVTGMMAADLAAEGFTGCRDALDIEERYNPEVTTNQLGESFLIMHTYFKRYSCCRWMHAPVEGLLTLIKEHNLSIGDIQEVRVETFLQAANLNNSPDPTSMESAQYSVPYAMAMAATLGEGSLMPMTADSLHRPETVALANKIKIERAEDLDPDFPACLPSRIFVTTATATYTLTVTQPWGEPDRPLRREDLVAKLKTLAQDRISSDRVTSIVSAVESLRYGLVGPLLETLEGN
ncbi:MAG: MmgE/PrpD family protein [Pseudomonadales bacterium]|nr:MmgE/PrpD family protein [Pseudomonadales bacterium]